MLTEQEFFGLLQRPEGETLDFKQDSYDLSLDHKKFDLIKDVLCMANTPRDHDSHIVLGVKKYPDGRFDLLGIEQHPDEELLQSQFTDKIYPIPRFTYEAVWYKEKTFGVITVPPERIGPCAPLRDYGRAGNFLRQRQIYFRRGSKNDVAGPEDAKSIFNWIGFEGLQVDQILQGTTHGEEWEKFLEAVHNFSPAREYLLVTNVPATGICDQVGNLGAVDWSFVVDLDPSSDRNGVFKEVSHRLNQRRNVHRMVKGDRPPLNLARGTYWFFARGLEGSPNLLS